jgi:predicted DNA-binding antitoxin AbrB/MazE fold protein
MATTIRAIYEGGVLRPTDPVDLADGTPVEVIVIDRGASVAKANQAAADILAEIASIPPDGPDPFAGKDHDEVLYGGELCR